MEAGIGERHDPETHLIPIVLEAALGKRPHVTIFGDDWDTPDGTCIRDYIHVTDLAEAHLAALAHLGRGGARARFQPRHRSGALGARGHRRRRSGSRGRDVPVVIGPRRAGDAPVLVASVDRARRVLGWEAKRASLDEIVSDAWKWHSSRA